jgi:hypothetical protein
MSEIKAATDNLILIFKTSIKEMVVSNQKCVQVCEQVGSIELYRQTHSWLKLAER